MGKNFQTEFLFGYIHTICIFHKIEKMSNQKQSTKYNKTSNDKDNTEPMLNIDDSQLMKIHKNARKERNELLHYDGKKFHAKICCICDQFIKHKSCQPIPVCWLLDTNVAKCLTATKECWNKFDLLDVDKERIKQYYTQKCLFLRKILGKKEKLQ